jgi:hypothetical protein
MNRLCLMFLIVAGACGASYSQSSKIPSAHGLNFSSLKISKAPDIQIDCYAQHDSLELFWSYFDLATCVCPCGPTLAIGSNKTFYVSKKAMNFSEYRGNTFWPPDTTLFAKCSTSTGTKYLVSLWPCNFPSEILQCKYPYGPLTQSTLDSVYTRLLVFATRINGAPRYLPVKIDSVITHGFFCSAMGGPNYYPIYDSLCISWSTSVQADVPVRSVSQSIAPARHTGPITVSGRTLRGVLPASSVYVDKERKLLRTGDRKQGGR